MSYDYLRSKPGTFGDTIFDKLGTSFEEVANLPVKYLGLDTNASKLLSEQNIVENGVVSSKFNTLGDIVKFGYKNICNLIESELKYAKFEPEILYDIQYKLAKFALKLNGTEFSVFDIKVQDLGLEQSTIEFVNKVFKAETLGDIYLVGSKNFNKYFKKHPNPKLQKEILVAMKRFGTHPEKSDEEYSDELDEETYEENEEYSDMMIERKLGKAKFNEGPFPSIMSKVERERREKKAKENDIVKTSKTDEQVQASEELTYSEIEINAILESSIKNVENTKFAGGNNSPFGDGNKYYVNKNGFIRRREKHYNPFTNIYDDFGSEMEL